MLNSFFLPFQSAIYLVSKTLSLTNSAHVLFINFLARAVLLVMSVKPPDISQHVCVNICQRTESLMFTNIYRIQINVETSAQRKIHYLGLCLHCLSIKNHKSSTYTLSTTISQQACFLCQFKSFYMTSYNISFLFYLHTLNGILNITIIHCTYFN